MKPEYFEKCVPSPEDDAFETTNVQTTDLLSEIFFLISLLMGQRKKSCNFFNTEKESNCALSIFQNWFYYKRYFNLTRELASHLLLIQLLRQKGDVGNLCDHLFSYSPGFILGSSEQYFQCKIKLKLKKNQNLLLVYS